MPLQFIKSQKGHDLLSHNGFLFRKERSSTEKTIWKCVYYDSKKCPGRCHTSDNEVIKFTNNHNHVPDATTVPRRKVMLDIKEKATTSQATTHQVLAQATVGISQAVAGQLPSTSLIKRTIQRTRQREGRAPPCPTNLRDLVIPEEFTQSSSGEPFLLFDSGPSEDRLLIFSTRRNLQLLAQCEHWYADGTFKTAPPLFSQLYTIHGVKYNNVLPSVFVLMPSKTERAYERVFTALTSLEPSLWPASIMTDFELASINAFQHSFPTAIHRGCFFHLGQCIWRKIQAHHDLQDRYKNDPDFALNVRMLPALAFVPENDVVEAFEEVVESPYYLQEQHILQPLVDYFEDVWIGRPQRGNRRRPPTYKHSLWNCYDSTLDGLPKTNNAVEGWHLSFSNLLCAHHPTIWKFINGLKQEQSLNDFKINQYLAGEEPPAQRRKYRECAKRITTIVQDYGQRPLLDYLVGIAYNFSLNV
jgi:hypothetical protein